MEERIPAQERIIALEKQLADLQARLPKHSTPPAMIWQMEKLEEELEEELDKIRAEGETNAASHS